MEKNLLVADFLLDNEACAEWAAWAESLGAETMEVLFNRLPQDLTGAQAAWVIWAYTRKGVLDHKDLVRFAVYCAKQVEGLMPQAYKDVLAVAVRWLDGTATLKEVTAASWVAVPAALAHHAAHADTASWASAAASAAADTASWASASGDGAYCAAFAAAKATAKATAALEADVWRAQAAFLIATFGNPFFAQGRGAGH